MTRRQRRRTTRVGPEPMTYHFPAGHLPTHARRRAARPPRVSAWQRSTRCDAAAPAGQPSAAGWPDTSRDAFAARWRSRAGVGSSLAGWLRSAGRVDANQAAGRSAGIARHSAGLTVPGKPFGGACHRALRLFVPLGLSASGLCLVAGLLVLAITASGPARAHPGVSAAGRHLVPGAEAGRTHPAGDRHPRLSDRTPPAQPPATGLLAHGQHAIAALAARTAPPGGPAPIPQWHG